MKQSKCCILLILFLIGGVQLQPAYALDAKATLKKADSFYTKGDRPEKALELYRVIIADGSDKTSVILSKLKTAYVYEEQLMQYDQAIVAYHRFMNDYPDSRLTKIVTNKAKRLEALRDNGELTSYKQFKILEKNYQTASRSQKKKANRVAALELHQYALANINQSFRADVMPRVVTTLAQERLFLKAHLLIRQLEATAPAEDQSSLQFDSVKHDITKAALVMAAKIVIGICLLFVLTGRGFKPAFEMVKHSKLRLSIIIGILLIYLFGYHGSIIKWMPNEGLDMKWLHFVLIECAILLPFSLVLYHSFPYLKKGWLKSIMIWVICALLATSCWVIFCHKFNFLLETRM